MRSGRKLIYLAGPLFSHAEKSENNYICKALEKSCDVFLPQRDGELVPHLVQRGLSDRDAYRVVFERDMAAVRECDALVINLDGRAVDEGAAFELGVAYSLEKVCVGYHTDARVLLPWGLNPMITGPLSQIFSCIETLGEWAEEFQSQSEVSRPRLVKWTTVS